MKIKAVITLILFAAANTINVSTITADALTPMVSQDTLEIIIDIPSTEDEIKPLEAVIEPLEDETIQTIEETEIEPIEAITEPLNDDTIEEIEESVQIDLDIETQEPVQEETIEIPETVEEPEQVEAPVITRESNIYVNGISVYITPSISDNDYNMVIGWISEMPYFLTEHIETISVVDDITEYTLTGENASGVTKQGKNIYINAVNIYDKQGTLYHEAGHCLDFFGGYSDTSTWNNICNSEWYDTGYYATTRESFAEAVSMYYVDGLNKSQSYEAIESLINTGTLGEDDGFKDNYTTLYAKYKTIWIYAGADDFYNEQIGTVEIGDSIQAIGLNVDGTWYKVDINGQEGYCRADMVSLVS